MQTDVCVIGGGPAGSVLAAQLSVLGNRVVLVERSEFPRRHLGESLTPGVRTLLESIGAGDIFGKAGASPVESVLVNWDTGLRERIDPECRGTIVDRGRFDALLLKHANAAGVQVLQPAVFRDCSPLAEGWRITVEKGGETIHIGARFLADASGRVFATRGRKRRAGARTTAFYAYWKGSDLPKQPRVEAGSDAWYWGVPIPDGTYNTLVFVDPRTYSPDMIQEMVARSGLLEGCRDIHLISAFQAADATPYMDEQSVTHSSIKVGDAALSIDPLSSSGVQKAIQTALSGTVVVNTLLRRQESQAAAVEFYQSSLLDASERHSRWASEYYGAAAATRKSEFWRQRSSVNRPAEPVPALNAGDFADEQLALSADLRLVESPCIDGEFVTLKTAMRHPGLERPVTYVAGSEMPPLVRRLRPGLTPMEIAVLWSDKVPIRTGLALTSWLIRNRLLIPAVDEKAVQCESPRLCL
ncbi:MAG TPA: NAD(P)/FAD-dependent oxidoreductase [Acidobacteriaceae bacterium]|nr:NAD(P)/FAD-dependent oxidoreductase [Acidobacteriaceae bacterium]